MVKHGWAWKSMLNYGEPCLVMARHNSDHVHGEYGYYVCSVSDRLMCSVLAICRCIAPCARCQDLFNPKKHTRVQMPRDEFSKMWRGNSLEARKKARKKKRNFPIFSKLGWIGMCFCLNSLLLVLLLCLCCCRSSAFVSACCADFLAFKKAQKLSLGAWCIWMLRLVRIR